MSASSPSVTPNDFFESMMVNLDNEKMDDKAFREFIRNSTRGMEALPSIGLMKYGRDARVQASAATLIWLEDRLGKGSRADKFVEEEVRFLPEKRQTVC